MKTESTKDNAQIKNKKSKGLKVEYVQMKKKYPQNASFI